MKPLAILALVVSAVLLMGAAHDTRINKRDASDQTITVSIADPNATRYLKWNDSTNLPVWGQWAITDEQQFSNPHQVDGTGATIDAVTTSATYGHALFSGATDKATNFVLYRLRVPADLDTSVDWQACLTIRLNAADTGKQAFEISMADVTSSASADSPTFSNAVALNFPGDASGANADIETLAYATLTSWKSSVTAGHILVIKLARDGDDGTNDTSTQVVSDVNLSVKFGRIQ